MTEKVKFKPQNVIKEKLQSSSDSVYRNNFIRKDKLREIKWLENWAAVSASSNDPPLGVEEVSTYIRSRHGF